MLRCLCYAFRTEFVGILSLSSYRVGPGSSSDISKEASGAVHDGSKPCGCFGRDTIANAAAKVGPAVVNISIPQGFYILILMNCLIFVSFEIMVIDWEY